MALERSFRRLLLFSSLIQHNLIQRLRKVLLNFTELSQLLFLGIRLCSNHCITLIKEKCNIYLWLSSHFLLISNWSFQVDQLWIKISELDLRGRIHSKQRLGPPQVTLLNFYFFNPLLIKLISHLSGFLLMVFSNELGLLFLEQVQVNFIFKDSHVDTHNDDDVDGDEHNG